MDLLYDEFRKQEEALRKKGCKLSFKQSVVELRLPGVFAQIHFRRGVHFRMRTARGGYTNSDTMNDSKTRMRCFQASQGEACPTSLVDDIIKTAKHYSDICPAMPKRCTSKSQLPAPRAFVGPCYVTDADGYTQYNGVTRCCHVDRIVAISNTLRLAEPTKPGTDPWFYLNMVSMTHGFTSIITTSTEYYFVNTRSGRVTPHSTQQPLTLADQKLITAAIKRFLGGR